MSPPEWSSAVPTHQFTGDGALLKQTQSLVEALCTLAYVRIVDKHPSALWGLCKQWAWDAHTDFVTTEGYRPTTDTLQVVTRRLRQRVVEECWKLGA